MKLKIEMEDLWIGFCDCEWGLDNLYLVLKFDWFLWFIYIDIIVKVEIFFWIVEVEFFFVFNDWGWKVWLESDVLVWRYEKSRWFIVVVFVVFFLYVDSFLFLL